MSFQSVKFLVPASSAEPMALTPEHSGLEMVLVSRASVPSLNDEWKALGIYFLLGPSEGDPDRYRAYVGEVGRSTLVKRVRRHARRKEWWNRALLVRSSVSPGFDSAEIGWLEGRLYDVLGAAAACEVMNRNRPGDDSLPSYRREMLERYVDPVIAALRACGASLDPAEKTSAPAPARKPRAASPGVAGSELVVLLTSSGLGVPLGLHAIYRGNRIEARIETDGSVSYGETRFSSLSTAASAARAEFGYRGTRSKPSTNGWIFWHYVDADGETRPLKHLRRTASQA